MSEDIKIQVQDVKMLKPSNISANDYNPNVQSEDEFNMLKDSIRQDGFTSPILVREMTEQDLEAHENPDKGDLPNPDADYVIVDGEHRFKAGRDLGLSEIPSAVSGMNRDQAMKSTVRHNEATGDHQADLMGEMMEELDDKGALDEFQQDLGFSDEDVDQMMSEAGTLPEDFEGEDFSAGWEPVEDEEAEDEDYEAKNSEGDVSRTSTSRNSQRAEKTERQKEDEEAGKDITQVNRKFIMAESQANLVDKVLGDEAANNLVKICKYINSNGGVDNFIEDK